jgi:MYXO-CTERM domain-containing protein
MRYTTIAALCLGVVAIGGGPARATPTRAHRGLMGPPTTGPADVAAAAFLQDHAARLRLEAVSLMAAPRVLRVRDARVVRFAQEHEGLPVFGRGVVVRLDAAGRVRSVADHTASGLDLVTTPGIREVEAYAAASLHWGLVGLVGLGAPEVVLGVLPAGRQPALAYRVDGSRGLERVRSYVDAITGQVLVATSLRRSARAWVYLQNPVATPDLADVELLHRSGDATGLTGRFGEVVRHVSGTINIQDPQSSELVTAQTPTSDGESFYFEPTADASQPEFDDPFAEAQAYYHVDTIYGFFQDTFGFDPDYPYRVIVNYSEAGGPYDNAMFTPLGTSTYGLVLGQGRRVDFAYDGDVIYHEFTHSVIHDLTQMGYVDTLFDQYGANPGPGAIHEGLADYFACSFTDESRMGEYSLAPNGGARNLSNHRSCPDNLLGEMHEDGEILGGATWAIRTALDSSALADDLIYLALTQLPSNATFRDFAEELLAGVDDRVTDGTMTSTQRDAIHEILEARGLLACGRDYPLAVDQDLGINLIGLTTVGSLIGVTCQQVRQFGLWLPAALQFKVSTPVNATAVSFTITYPSGSSNLQYRLYARQGEMVQFDLQSVFGYSVPVAADFDQALATQTDTTATITVSADSDPAFVPGADYYFVITHQNCPLTVPTVTAEVDTSPLRPDAGVPDAALDAAVTPDASGTPPGSKGQGCGCASTGAGEGLALLFLALGALIVIRRRR